MRDHEVVPLGQPEVDVTEFADGGDLKFTAEVDVPSARSTLPDYNGLRSTSLTPRSPRREIDEQIDALRARFATLTPVERAAQDG